MPDLVEGFALGPHVHKPLYMLSTGSRRKVWLTAALAAGTALTLLDEPFAALDMPSVRFLREALNDASRHASRAWVLADHEAPKGWTSPASSCCPATIRGNRTSAVPDVARVRQALGPFEVMACQLPENTGLVGPCPNRRRSHTP